MLNVLTFQAAARFAKYELDIIPCNGWREGGYALSVPK